MLNVFLTIDVELWMTPDGRKGADVSDAMQRYIYGCTSRGSFGLPFQFATFQDHGLKSVCFTESLFVESCGAGPLAEIVGLAVDAGQDVQLHAHTEWLRTAVDPQMRRCGQHIRQFSEPDQTMILQRAIHNLRTAGAPKPLAFRAGNYGANNATLRVLCTNDVLFDSSYNFPFIPHQCQIEAASPLLQPALLDGLIELPITFFEDFRHHRRHAQLAACSFTELSRSLETAADEGHWSFVIVSHSGELLNKRRNRPDPVMVRRFRKLCRFLENNQDRMRTRTFGDLKIEDVPVNLNARPLGSTSLRTASRFAEQALRRLF